MLSSNKFYANPKYILVFFVVSNPLVVAQRFVLFESLPEWKISLSESSQERGFVLAPTEANSGKFLISVSLVSFLCRIENNDPAPYLDVSGENGLSTRWRCGDLASRQDWLTLDALAGSRWFNITASSDTVWEKGWEALVVGTLYQTNYTLAGACPQGYFDCKSPSAMCHGQNRQHDTQRCIPDNLICDKRPSCGMLCNADEADICNRTTTTPRNKSGNNDSEFPTWVYYTIGGCIFGVSIIYGIFSYIRNRKARNARLIRDGIQLGPAPIPVPAPVEPSWSNAKLGEGGASRRNSRDVSEAVTVPVFGPMKDYN